MDILERVHVFGFTIIHTFESNISLIRLFGLIPNHAKLRLLLKKKILILMKHFVLELDIQYLTVSILHTTDYIKEKSFRELCVKIKNNLSSKQHFVY